MVLTEVIQCSATLIPSYVPLLHDYVLPDQILAESHFGPAQGEEGRETGQ